MNKDTFCPLPFYHLAIRPNGKVFPCCVFDWSEVPDDLNVNSLNVFHHPFMEKIREQMIKGEPVKGCNKCYTNENKTGISSRLHFLAKSEYYGIPAKPTDSPEIIYLDLALSNACNNKCRMCGPELSTSWYADTKSLNQKIPKGILYQDKVLENYDLSKLKFIKFLGGEPLMEQDKFIDVLKRCNRKDLMLLVTTNATLTPNDELYELLKECKLCNFNLSIDADKDLNDFLRKNSKWDKTIEIIDWFYKNILLKNVGDVNVHSIVSIYNINRLDKLYYFIKEHYPKITLKHAMIDGPDWMHPKHLPESVKTEMKQKLSVWCDELEDPFLKIVISELDKQGDFRQFIKNDKSLSDVRNENWAQVNIELYEMVKQYYE